LTIKRHIPPKILTLNRTCELDL